MNEPKRLLEEGGTSFERTLLSALAAERPSPALTRRMHQGVGFAGVATGAKLAAASHTAFTWVGLVAAGLAAGVAASEVRELRATPVFAPTAAPRETFAPETAEPPAPASAPAAAVPSEPLPSPPRARSAAPRSGDLRDEIRLLDRARALVRGKSADEALKVLARYDRQYPAGQFRQEMLVLRVEALSLAGNQKAARALGKQFLADHPESPHAERLERVTAPR